MGVMTVAGLRGGLATTVKACDRCHQPAGVLAGRPDYMLCGECSEREDGLRASRAALHADVAGDAKAAQSTSRRRTQRPQRDHGGATSAMASTRTASP